MSLVSKEVQSLDFRRPFTTGVVKETLKLHNSSADTVAFKIKTTAPKQYCVRPNAGIVDPGATVEIAVMLQPMQEDPPADFKCKDKFLVQCVPFRLTADFNTDDTKDLWSEAESLKISDVSQRKLRVSFLPADSASREPPAYSEVPPPQPADTPKESKQSSTLSLPPVQVSAVPQQQPAVAKPASASTSIAPVSTGSVVSSTAETGSSKKEQADAKAEIKRLKELVEKYQQDLLTTKSELRQRVKTDTTATSSAQSKEVKVKTVPPQQQQFPLQVVLAVALIAFLFGVLFF